MNPYYEFLFLVGKITMVGLAVTGLSLVGRVFYDRYVNGNVDAFKPERRVGAADRRSGAVGP